jgi:hypothetical protein
MLINILYIMMIELLKCYRCKKDFTLDKKTYKKVIDEVVVYFCGQDCQDITIHGYPVLREY